MVNWRTEPIFPVTSEPEETDEDDTGSSDELDSDSDLSSKATEISVFSDDEPEQRTEVSDSRIIEIVPQEPSQSPQQNPLLEEHGRLQRSRQQNFYLVEAILRFLKHCRRNSKSK